MQKVKVRASTVAVKKTFKPKKTTADMLDAFEAKLDELGVDPDTVEGCSVTASRDFDDQMRTERQVEIFEEDYHDRYQDVGGGFGDPGDFYTLADIKGFWNDANVGDPVLEMFPSFDVWWRETRNNYMVEA